MTKHKSTIIGATGEHYVAAFLSAKGLVVALPRGGIPTTDLLVTTEHGGKAISLQVKTGTSSHMTYKRKPQDNYWLWDTGFKAMEVDDDHHWYAYVYLNDWPSSQNQPKVFFVPSKNVARCIREQHGKEKRPFFWMMECEAEEFSELTGFNLLYQCLVESSRSNSQPAAADGQAAAP